jgi:hypothetical protein
VVALLSLSARDGIAPVALLQLRVAVGYLALVLGLRGLSLTLVDLASNGNYGSGNGQRCNGIADKPYS